MGAIAANKLIVIEDTMPSNQTWNRDGLPAWSYRSSAVLALEKNRVFLNDWHVVGHVNALQSPGDWFSFNLLGERAMVSRGEDGVIREPITPAVIAEVMREDKHVCQLHDQATASKDWEKGLLGESEKALHKHHDMLLDLIPELNQTRLN